MKFKWFNWKIFRKTPENVGWKANEPTEIVIESFQKGIIKPGDELLDIGGGFGRNSNWLAQNWVNVTVVNIDDKENKEAMEKAKKLGVNVKYLHADARSLPFSNKSFDVVLDLGCSHMIPDINGQKKAETESARVLRLGGSLIYFGFSKKHPDFLNNTSSPKFRDIEDIQGLYGNDFVIISSQETRWKAKLEENTKFSEHVGINVIMKRK